MWYDAKATKKIGIDYPILQGPFGGGLSSIELTATVSNAGGLGGYGAYGLSAQEIYEVNRQLKQATNKPFNINLWVSDIDVANSIVEDDRYESTKEMFKIYFEEAGIPIPERPKPYASRFEDQLQVILDIRPKVFSFMFGTLSPEVLEQCHKVGISTVGAATTLDEALVLESSGVDFIIASGFEAGGHRPSFLGSAETSLTGTFVLVQLIKEKVKTPVIAAGGIANGRGIAAAFMLGADAVQIGTAFLACDESNALPIHKQMLFSEAAKYTALSKAFTGRLGRGMSNRITKDLTGIEQQLLPFPLQNMYLSPLRQAAIDQKIWEMVFFWGGQIAPILKHKRATDLMQSLIAETTEIMR